jgi:diadenylate cyclase
MLAYFIRDKQVLNAIDVNETAITTLSIVTMLMLIVLLILQIIFMIYGNEVRNFFRKFSFFKIKKKQDTKILVEFINNLASVLSKMSKDKIGALIVIENKDNLAAYINIGNRIDSPFSPELVVSIFYNKLSALHDGAMIIRD